MSKPICIAFPTIMSGRVLRWYADEDALANGDELANAGREGVWCADDCPQEVRDEAREASEAIKAADRVSFFAKPNTRKWETHELTGGIFSDEITPLPVHPAPSPATPPQET